MRNNSKDETTLSELEAGGKYFENSGYNREKLHKLKEKAINKSEEPSSNVIKSEPLVFPISYFNGLKILKSVVHNLEINLKN